MPEIRTEITVDATPARIFEILADSARWPEWNPILRVVRGRLGPDARFIGRLAGGALPLVFDAAVTRFEPARSLAWKGPRSALVQRLASGEHYFELEARGAQTLVVHGERFEGLLPNLGPLWQRVEGNLHRAYRAFNKALKARAESR